MRHPEGPRFDRRLKARRAARQKAEEEANQPPPIDRRQKDRRELSMSPQEVEAWLKHNGILGGDRRKGDRRRR